MSLISLDKQKKTCCSSISDLAETIIHLPVAPQVVARTRFSPPTPTHCQCLMVPEALTLLDRTMQEKGEKVSMVAISGPGDPLATPDITLATIMSVHKSYPKVDIGIKTHGIGCKSIAGELAQAGLNYLELQVDGVRAEILEKLYAWIRPASKTLKISEAASLLIDEQRNGVPALKFHNIPVSILTTLYPGYNIDHIPKISVEMMELGADSIALIPYSPSPGVEVDLESPTAEVVTTMLAKTSKSLPNTAPRLIQYEGMNDCCSHSPPATTPLPQPTKERPNVAVVSSNGIEIDLHLGHAIRFLIYGPRKDGLTCLLEARNAPEPGKGKKRWIEMAAILKDCFIILTASAGETPRRVLAEKGLRVLITNENIEGTVDVLYGGGKKGKKKNTPEKTIDKLVKS